MYFWNAEQLAQALRQHEIKQADVFKSFLFVTVLAIIQAQISYILKFNTNSSLLSVVIAAIVNIAIAIGGITWMYIVNKDGDNENFVERYICLSVPLSIQILIINILLYIIYLFALGATDKYFKEYISLQAIVNSYSFTQLLTLLYFFILMRKFLRLVSVKNC